MQLTTTVLIGSVRAIAFAVAEQTALHAGAVAASQKALLAQRFVGVQQRLHFALLALELAVLDGVFPVARLLLNVKVETGRASDRLQTLHSVAQKSKRMLISVRLENCKCFIGLRGRVITIISRFNFL